VKCTIQNRKHVNALWQYLIQAAPEPKELFMKKNWNLDSYK
jgi:hypothetical protein